MVSVSRFGRSQGLLFLQLLRQSACKAAEVHGLEISVIFRHGFREIGKTLQVPHRLITLAVAYQYHQYGSLLASACLLPSSSRPVH